MTTALYTGLLQIGISFLQQFLGSVTTAKAPQDVLDGVQAAITSLQAHAADVMSKNDWEGLRG